jgi:hypothetical protein
MKTKHSTIHGNNVNNITKRGDVSSYAFESMADGLTSVESIVHFDNQTINQDFLKQQCDLFLEPYEIFCSM